MRAYDSVTLKTPLGTHTNAHIHRHTHTHTHAHKHVTSKNVPQCWEGGSHDKLLTRT